MEQVTKRKEITDVDLDLIDKLLRAKHAALAAERHEMAQTLHQLVQQVRDSG